MHLLSARYQTRLHQVADSSTPAAPAASRRPARPSPCYARGVPARRTALRRRSPSAYGRYATGVRAARSGSAAGGRRSEGPRGGKLGSTQIAELRGSVLVLFRERAPRGTAPAHARRRGWAARLSPGAASEAGSRACRTGRASGVPARGRAAPFARRVPGPGPLPRTRGWAACFWARQRLPASGAGRASRRVPRVGGDRGGRVLPGDTVTRSVQAAEDRNLYSWAQTSEQGGGRVRISSASCTCCDTPSKEVLCLKSIS